MARCRQTQQVSLPTAPYIHRQWNRPPRVPARGRRSTLDAHVGARLLSPTGRAVGAEGAVFAGWAGPAAACPRADTPGGGWNPPGYREHEVSVGAASLRAAFRGLVASLLILWCHWRRRGARRPSLLRRASSAPSPAPCGASDNLGSWRCWGLGREGGFDGFGLCSSRARQGPRPAPTRDVQGLVLL